MGGMQVVPYLNFKGQCAAAFQFYEQVLGGEILFMQTHRETPFAEQVPAELLDKVMHARLKLGDNELFGSDAPMAPERAQGIYISLVLDDPAEAERIFQAMAENGTVQMPLGETFWAVRFGMVVDQFGIPWMINCEKAA